MEPIPLLLLGFPLFVLLGTNPLFMDIVLVINDSLLLSLLLRVSHI